MTLCIAWQSYNQLYLAGDSRLSLAGAPPVDACAKVVRLPVSIRLLGTEDGRENFTVGLAFAGSFVTSYTVREILLELLPLAQVVPERVAPSLEFVARVVAKVFEDVCIQVCESLFEKGSAELLVAGYCPVVGRPRLFHIAPTIEERLIFTTTELATDAPYFIGSGAPRARELASRSDPDDMLRVLRQVIHDENVPEVGGPIQLGRTNSRDFEIVGIQDFEERDEVVTIRHLYRGLLARKLVEDIGIPYAHFATSYTIPFHEDLDAFAAAGKLIREEM